MPLKRARTTLIAVTMLALALVLAACGGSSPGASSGDDGSKQSAAASVAESSSTDGNGGDKSSEGPATGDAESIADALTPPSATETSRTTSGGLILVTYESTDSFDSLTSFYEGAMRDAGLNVTSTTTADGGANWTFDADDVSGSVTLVEGGASNGGVAVAISILDKSV
jgi:hypothetical protein